jgi:DNA-directed RNA polymerase sigma subunit (sigma70/sigma32)
MAEVSLTGGGKHFRAILPESQPDSLTDRQWHVLSLRAAGRTWQEIGAECGVTTERARQIAARAIRTLNGEAPALT